MAAPPPYAEKPPPYYYDQADKEDQEDKEEGQGEEGTPEQDLGDPPPYPTASLLPGTSGVDTTRPVVVHLGPHMARPTSPVMLQIGHERMSPVVVIGEDGRPIRQESPPFSWLPLSIFSCLCCFWPLGCAAVLFSTMAIRSSAEGNFSAARKHARAACALSIASLIVGAAMITAWYECKHQYAGHCGFQHGRHAGVPP